MKLRMKKFAAAAVMMAAITVAPQIPMAVPVVPHMKIMSAYAAKNAIDVEVVDMKTGVLIDGITVTVDDGMETWNTTDTPVKEILGAFNRTFEISLSNVPLNYKYNEKYVVDNATRTSSDFIIRLANQNDTLNCRVELKNHAGNELGSIYGVPLNIYDEKGNWYLTAMAGDSIFLPDGDYTIKPDTEALEKAGFRIIDKDDESNKEKYKDTELSGDNYKISVVGDGAHYEVYNIDVEPIDDKVEANAVFSVKKSDKSKPELFADTNQIIIVKGEDFCKSSDTGKLYLPDGIYTAELHNKHKYGIYGLDESYSDEQVRMAYEDENIMSWMDKLDSFVFKVEDGKPDRELIFDLSDETGKFAYINFSVVDHATGKPIKGVELELWVDKESLRLAKWNTADVEERKLPALKKLKDDKYVVRLKEIPEEYAFQGAYYFNVDTEEPTENWQIELIKKKDLVGSTARVSIVDAETGKNIDGINAKLVSATNASTKPLAIWNTTDSPVMEKTGLAAAFPYCYSVRLTNVPEGYDADASYLFYFKEDNETADWVIKLERNDKYKEKGVNVTVKVVDKNTGKAIKGIDAELMANINGTASQVGTWNTSDEAEKKFTGMANLSPSCYGVTLTNVPEKYNVKDQYIFCLDNLSKDDVWTIELSEKKPSSVTVSIVDKDGKPVEDVEAQLVEESTGKAVAEWNSKDEPAKTVSGLFGVYPMDSYIVKIKSLPDKYDYNKPAEVKFVEAGEMRNLYVVLDDADTSLSEAIGFGAYSRFGGTRENLGGIGSVDILDKDGKNVGTYDLSEKFRVPDGEYTAKIFVNCKGLGCFSDQPIKFKVKDRKPDKALRFNIERWDFHTNGNGDANNDDEVNMSDAVLIMQSIANPEKYGLKGTAKEHITEEGSNKADVDGEGITNMDALTIQKYLLGLIK